MYKIPNFLYDPKIYKHIQSLVRNGSDNYYSLSISDKENITLLILEVLGTDAYELLLGGDDIDKTIHYFSKFLRTSNQTDAYDLLEQMKINSLSYYSYDLDQLFEEIKEQEHIEEIAWHKLAS